MFKFLILFFITGFTPTPPVTHGPDQICGKWISVEKNLIVQVYKEGDNFKAKVVWFENIDNSKPMEAWTDKHNPDPSLRSRKLIGMNVLRDLDYVPKSNTWENGKIYDSKNGREWSASAYINDKGMLKVTGYWHFKFIGHTMTFVRI